MAFFRRLVPAGSRVLRVTDDERFLAELPTATHVVTWHFRKEWFHIAKSLKYLATPSAGRELIAWRDAPKKVKVHFGGFHGRTMAEAAAGFMLAWSHGFFRPEIRDARLGDVPWKDSWPRTAIGAKCSNLRGTFAVVAGYGKVGRAVGAVLEVLGVRVFGVTRANLAELPKAAAKADWLVLVLPSDTGTDRFLDEKLISMLPRKCVVVNIGRGNAVDEPALLDALKARRLAGAYLDVFCGEPLNLPQGAGYATAKPGTILSARPNELPDNLVMMPHSSAFSSEYLTSCFRELKDDGFF